MITIVCFVAIMFTKGGPVPVRQCVTTVPRFPSAFSAPASKNIVAPPAGPADVRIDYATSK